MSNLDRYIFRGISVETGEWVYGYLAKGPGGAWIIPNLVEYSSPVIPETIGQWVFSNDQNGKKIFEGDLGINLAEGDRPFSVEWSEGYGQFLWGRNAFALPTHGEWQAKFKIIGSIHDHLLRKQ